MIFTRTVAEGQEESFSHFADDPEGRFEGLLEEVESVADGELTGVEVGVEPEQYAYPAWFVASGQIPFDEGTLSMFARFEREEVDEPWLMTTLQLSTERLLPAPALDEDGWLAPPTGELLVDPASLPERYLDWLVRANEDQELGEDELLTLRFDEGGLIRRYTAEVPFFEEADANSISYEFETTAGEVVTDPVPLVDGTVHVTFTATVRQTTYNTPDRRGASCATYYLFWLNNDPPGRFRWMAQDMTASVDAWIPVVEPAAPGPTPGPTSTPTPEPTPDPDEEESEGEESEDESEEELELEPVDPERVVIEDWKYEHSNRDGERC